jgi:beta-phosphoglucomutase family hydrolase
MQKGVLDQFQAVVFDLDGVLTDTASIHASAWKRAMDRMLVAAGASEVRFDPVRDYRAHIDGRPRLDGAEAFLRSRGIRLDLGTPEDPPGTSTLWALASLKNRLFLAELEERGVRVFPDARRLLDELRRRAVPQGVVTASENGGRVLGRAGLTDSFAATVTGVEASAWHLAGKPAPDTYLRAAELLGVHPARCVVVEDAVAGVQAGRAGGFGLVVGVDRGGAAADLSDNGADVVVSELDALLSLTDPELTRRARLDVLSAPVDPRWCLVVRGDDRRHARVLHSLLTVADTQFGTRGTREEDPASAVPGTLAAGVFDESVRPTSLLEGPGWTSLQVDTALDSSDDVRTLDLRTGVLHRVQPASPVPLRSVRFACLGRPGVQVLRAIGGAGWLHGGPALTPPMLDGTFTRRQAGSRTTALSSADEGGTIAAAVTQTESLAEGGTKPLRVVERIVALTGLPAGLPHPDVTEELLDAAQRLGFEALLAEQRQAWSQRWEAAEISIDGDPANELAVRFALFHLMAASPVSGEAAIGPRGLSGHTYRGHVFWDSDVFILPFLAATSPPAAQAMMRYRTRRLPAARRAAAAQGRRGARFPWESARTGVEVTPTQSVSPYGEVTPILTGQYEEHITADVAWAAQQLVLWTGRESLLGHPTGQLLTETARYWASRARLDADGRAHIDGVMGPDEYHEVVDDNAFTNVMARWNLRTAAARVGHAGGPSAQEADGWRALSEALVDNHDPQTGVYEQFRGYNGLEDLRVADLGTPPIAADLLLGRERISASQIIKQPDVLMAHHMVPEELATGSLRPNLDFYLPRCAHGSSLSPAIHAGLQARDGRPDEALHLFDMACRLDLEDLTGTTAGGLHMATFGGVWQALVHGFAGIRPMPDRLCVDPHLPGRWDELTVRVRYHEAQLVVALRQDRIQLTTDRPVTVQVAGGAPFEVGTSGRIWNLTHDEWRTE